MHIVDNFFKNGEFSSFCLCIVFDKFSYVEDKFPNSSYNVMVKVVASLKFFIYNILSQCVASFV